MRKKKKTLQIWLCLDCHKVVHLDDMKDNGHQFFQDGVKNYCPGPLTTV